MAAAAGVLFAVSPFAVLQPLAYLVRTGEYSLRYDWIYLAARAGRHAARRAPPAQELLLRGPAEHRRRALSHRGSPAVVRPAVLGGQLIVVGLLALAAGFMLDRRARRARRAA